MVGNDVKRLPDVAPEQRVSISALAAVPVFGDSLFDRLWLGGTREVSRTPVL